MELSFRPDKTVYWQTALASETFYIHARDIRRERSGLYAEIALYLQQALLASDDFNLRRNEDRKRLAKDAHSKFGEAIGASYPLDYLKHDLDVFCQELPKFWEEDRLTVESYEPGGAIPEVAFVLTPYIMEDTITIGYAPQGSGKSYFAQVVGLSVCGATNGFWKVPVPRPVLYVNLERPRRSVQRRAMMLMKALGIKHSPNMEYLHHQGAGLLGVAPKLRAWLREHTDGVFILDSLSRTGIGSLVEDWTANRTIDLMRSIGGTWLVLGHTPRGDESHLFGSTLQDAGADVMLRLTSEKRGNSLGIALEVTKANDIAFPKKFYMAFDFTEPDDLGRSDLRGVRRAEAKEFPDLLVSGQMTNEQKLIAYLQEVSEATPSEAATATLVPYTKVSTLFNTSDQFVFLRKQGKNRYYGLKSTETE